jgi:signal peptidase II
VLYFAIAALVIILDQASKRIIWEIFQYRGGMDVLDGVLRVTLSKNSGAVMGILSSSKRLLLVVTMISIVVLIFFAYRMRYAPAAKRIYLALIIGGAFGNLIDRLAAGEVLDFIDMGFGSYRWPTYNVADIAVTVGAVLLVFGYVVHPGPSRTGEPPAGPSGEGAAPAPQGRQ